MRDRCETVRRRLAHVRWIGGGSGAGKSTLAARLADEHGMTLYDAEQFSEYIPRTRPEAAPLLHAFLAMDMDERWVERSPEVMLETFHGFHGETFAAVVDDLLALPRARPVLAEGFSLLPRLVAPLMSRRSQAVWLLPTPDFRRFAFRSRGSTWTIPARTSDADRALANMLRRDELFTERVRREAEALSLTTIDVDGRVGVDRLAHQVSQALELSP